MPCGNGGTGAALNRPTKTSRGLQSGASKRRGWERDSLPGIAGAHTEEVSPWHPSPSLWNRAVQDAKKAVKEKRDAVMHKRSM